MQKCVQLKKTESLNNNSKHNEARRTNKHWTRTVVYLWCRNDVIKDDDDDDEDDNDDNKNNNNINN